MRTRVLALFLLLVSTPSVFADLEEAPEVLIETAVGSRATGFLGWKSLANKKEAVYEAEAKEAYVAPLSFDWREAGVVSPIKDQGSCGSCWAFGFTASLEAVASIQKDKKGLNLSEQELVSCDKAALGCRGGYMESVQYLVTHGQGLETDFPYVARNAACKEIPVAVKAASYKLIGTSRKSPTVEQIKKALVEQGPLFVTVLAGGNGWSGRTSSVTSCRRRGTTNHIVNIVGYTVKDEWIIRNSWGTSWGDKGYAKIKFGCDKVAEEAGYVTLDAK